MNNFKSPSCFCMALISVYETFLKKYQSWPAEHEKFDWPVQVRIWLHGLDVLTMCGSEEYYRRGYWQNEFDKLEPSEVAFLSNIRMRPFFLQLSLEEERLVYKTLRKLYCK